MGMKKREHALNLTKRGIDMKKFTTLFFTLVCVVGLVGCNTLNKKEDHSGDREPIPDATDVTEVTDVTDTTDTTDTTDGCLPKPGLYPMGEPLVADLNGDGKKEELRVEILPSEHEYQDVQISVTINGTNYTRVVEEAYGENPDTKQYYLARLDMEEAWVAIGLRYDGPSADPQMHLYRYTDQLEFLNIVGGYPYEEEGELRGAVVDERGVLHNGTNLQIFQTWSAPVEWRWTEDDVLEMVEQDIYYPYQWEEQEIYLLCELPVYEEPGEKEKSASIGVLTPQKVRITATDNEHWCYLEGEDGTVGWFYVDGYYDIPDVGLTAPEVFAGLLYAG